MNVLDEFPCESPDIQVDDLVVIKTLRGVETGKLIAPLTPVDGEIKDFGLKLIRRANPKDIEIDKEARNKTRHEEIAFCRKKIEELKLEMKIVEAEHLFGSGRIIFYFSAEGRVDFRNLVKDLAAEYKTRIELKQIGVRDEARILGDIGVCGRELCCRRHIKDFDPVGMKMAKLQKDSLDPTKISGHCGRLMCCLRYEYETYREMQRGLPKRGTSVITAEGNGDIISVNIIGQTVNVALRDRRIITCTLDELLDKPKDDSKPNKSNDRGNDSRQGSNRRDNKNERSNKSNQEQTERQGKGNNRPNRNKRKDNNKQDNRSGNGNKNTQAKESTGPAKPVENKQSVDNKQDNKNTNTKDGDQGQS